MFSASTGRSSYSIINLYTKYVLQFEKWNITYYGDVERVLRMKQNDLNLDIYIDKTLQLDAAFIPSNNKEPMNIWNSRFSHTVYP